MAIFDFSKYNNASTSQIDWKKAEREEFADEIIELQYEDGIRKGGFSNDLVQHENVDIEEDFRMYQDEMDKRGYTLERIKQLFTNYHFSDWIQEYALDEKTGYVDVYLYCLNEKLKLNTKVWLSGSPIDFYNNMDEYSNEYYIKYGYGIHKTVYGQLFLAQSNITIEKFIKDCFKEAFDPCYQNLAYDLNIAVVPNNYRETTDFYLVLDDYLHKGDKQHVIRYYELYNYVLHRINISEDKDHLNNISELDFENILFKDFKIFTESEDFEIIDTGENLVFNYTS